MARCSVAIGRAIPPIAATSFMHRSDIIETELGRLHFGDQASGVRPDLIDPPTSSGVNKTTAISTSADTIQTSRRSVPDCAKPHHHSCE